MDNFNFYSPTHILFGKEMHKDIGEYVKPYADKILLHYGGGSIKKSGLYEQVVASLQAFNVDFVELGGVQPNPRLDLVKQGIKICREEKINFILAVGGGSVIDSAKAIALGVPYNGDVWEFFLRKVTPKRALPIGAILTIPAAGSESSRSVVITNSDTEMKIGLLTNLVRPAFSILNPQLCFTLPPNQVANGICDMMAHIFERYFTNTKNVELSDKLCEGALQTIINNGPKVLADRHNYDAWAEIMWAGNIAHNGVLGAGREEDWASHSIEHAVSAVYDKLAHGAGLAIILPAWMQYVYKHDIPAFVQFAVRVWGVTDSSKNQEDVALKGIALTKQFFKSLGLPVTLSEVGIKETDLAMLAKKATQFGPVGSFKKLTEADVLAIYQIAYK